MAEAPRQYRDLRDRALIATLTYSFARITAALKMKVEDLRPQGAGWRLRLHEKGGGIAAHSRPNPLHMVDFRDIGELNPKVRIVGEIEFGGPVRPPAHRGSAAKT